MADTGRLDELKRRFDENPRRYFAPLANEYRKAGDAELAIELCRTYLPQQPTHMSGYIVYGQALHDAGRSDEAAAVFKQALTLDPENIIALRQLGDIARAAGDREEAMHWYGKVMELDPRNEELASFIGSLAEPAVRPAASGPERAAPPTIRPEPEPDDSAVRLEDIVSQPDVIQPPTQWGAPGFADTEPAWEHEFQGTAGDSLEGEPEAPFEVTAWPAAGSASEPVPAADSLVPEESIFAEHFLSHQEEDEESERQDERQFHDHDEHDRPSHAAVTEPEPRSAAPHDRREPDHDAAAMTDTDLPAGGTPASSFASPFVTETMAELYLQQGLRGEALGIYRQLALKRDDPALRDRIARLEREIAPPAPVETIREFFARIGGVRSTEKVEQVAGAATSPLESLFGASGAHEADVTAAQRIAAAFGAPRTSDAPTGDQHS